MLKTIFATALMILGPIVVWLGYLAFFDDAAGNVVARISGLIIMGAMISLGGLLSLHLPFVGWSRLSEGLASLIVCLAALSVTAMATGIAIRFI